MLLICGFYWAAAAEAGAGFAAGLLDPMEANGSSAWKPLFAPRLANKFCEFMFGAAMDANGSAAVAALTGGYELIGLIGAAGLNPPPPPNGLAGADAAA